jgi:hypothetical protein
MISMISVTRALVTCRWRKDECGGGKNMEIRLFLMRDRYGNLYMKGSGQAGTTGVDSFIEGESR